MNKESGYLLVNDNHQLYYERIGSISSPTVLFLHGGPGLGFSDKDKVFFDFKKCNVIFFDQRGSGRSVAKNLLDKNTTQDLIEDINHIYKYFDLEQTILFGGSWGSTLALIYAIQNPKKVKSLIMRGLFRGSMEDRLFYEMGAIKALFPNEWARVKEASGISEDKNVMSHMYKKIINTEDQESRRMAFELVLYGVSINNHGLDETLIDEVKAIDYYKKAKILSHYALNNLFIEDNYIEKNKRVLKDVPIHLVHGKTDFICPVEIAVDFAKGMENCELVITDEGHSPYTPTNKEALQKTVDLHISSSGLIS